MKYKCHYEGVNLSLRQIEAPSAEQAAMDFHELMKKNNKAHGKNVVVETVDLEKNFSNTYKTLNWNVLYSEETMDAESIKNDEPSNKKKNLTPDVSVWAMLHYAAGGICLILFFVALSEGADSEAQLIITLAIACFIFGTILQSLKTICFYLREIYKRMD